MGVERTVGKVAADGGEDKMNKRRKRKPACYGGGTLRLKLEGQMH